MKPVWIVLLCLLGAAVHAAEDMTATASRQALAARSGTLAPGQAATGVLAAGGRESWRVDLPAGHVVQGEFEGQGVALDLEDVQGRHLRRLARQGADAATDFEPIQIGQHQVQNHQIRHKAAGRVLQHGQAAGAIGHVGHLQARLPQILAHHIGQALIVFDH